MDILGTKIELIRAIKIIEKIGIIDAQKRHSEIIDFIESKKEISFNDLKSDFFYLIVELRRKKLIDFETTDENEYEEQAKIDEAFAKKFNFAKSWYETKTEIEQEIIDTLIQGYQVGPAMG